MAPAASISAQLQDWLRRKSVDAAEIFIETCCHSSVQAKDGGVESFNQAEETGVALRLERDAKFGFAYTTDLSPAALERMALLAYNGAAIVEPHDPQKLPTSLAAIDSTPWPEYDATLADRPTAERVACALKLEKIAKDYDPRIRQVRGATYQEDRVDVYLWNSQQGERQYQRTRCEIQLMVMAAEGESQESAWEMDFAPFFDQIDPAPIAEKVAADAVGMLHAKTLATGRYPAILDRGVVASFLGILAPSFLADSIQKKKSRLAEKRGKKIYADAIDLIDDGLYQGGYLSAPFDGEGVSSQTTTLVSAGTLQHYLYDSVTAAIEKTASTGNSVRGHFKEMPHPGTRNFYIRPGSVERSDLAAGIDQGVEICDVIGIHTANAITGDFSVGASGYRIAHGKRAEAVRSFAISGNLHEILARVEAVASDLKFYGSVGAPSMRITALDVGGT